MKVLLIGCGHLAKNLISVLNGSKYELTGLSRSFAFQMKSSIVYELGEKLPALDYAHFKVMLWMTPPEAELLETLKAMNKVATASTPWIFISSTSYYGQTSGTLSEESPGDPQARVFPMETFLASLKRPVCILRSGGLIDEERHPANFFTGKAQVNGAKSPTNLVHTLDVARFIKHVMEYKLWSGPINVVSSQHPTREEFYTQVMRSKKIKTPLWLDEASHNRLISNQKSLQTDFLYQYDDLLAHFCN